MKAKILMITGLFASVTALTVAMVGFGNQEAYAACPALDATYGTATADQSTDASLGDLAQGTYYIYSRVKHADGKPQYKISISGTGGDTCGVAVVDNNANNAGNWEWIKAGQTVNWTKSGAVTIQMAGTKDGVGLDCVVLHPDANWNPSTKEDCNPAAQDKTPPQIPPSLKATSSTSSIDLSWGAASDNSGGSGVKEYKIYRRVSGQSFSATPLKVVDDSQTSYSDTTAQAGTTYEYAITAVDYGGNESQLSSAVAAKLGGSAACLTEDVDKNGVVNIVDVQNVMNNRSSIKDNPAAKFNIDGKNGVNVLDMILVARKNGQSSNCN